MIDFHSSAQRDAGCDKMDTIFICVGSWAAGMCDSVYVSSDTYSVCVCVCVCVCVDG